MLPRTSTCMHKKHAHTHAHQNCCLLWLGMSMRERCICKNMDVRRNLKVAHSEATTLKSHAATHMRAHEHTLMHVIIAVFYGVSWAAARKLGNVPAMPRWCSCLTQLLTRCLHSPLQATQTNKMIPFQKICTLS